MRRHRAQRTRRARWAVAASATALVVGGALLVLPAAGIGQATRSAGDLPGPPTRTATAGAVAAALDATPAATSPVAAVATPTAVSIPAIGVQAPLIPLGVQADGSLQVPSDVTHAGWYSGGPAPGAQGAAVVAGHLDDWKGPGVFARLAQLVPGDAIVVQRADGTSATFTVTRLEQVPKDRFPTDDVYGPVPDAELRVITCGGVFSTRTRHYEDNVLVFATLAS